MRTNCATWLVACLTIVGCAGAAHADSYSKAVQKSCAADYHKYCGEYGLESTALRGCMDRAGKSLSKACVQGADPVGRSLTSRSRPPQAQLAATSFLSYRRKPVSRTARSEIVVLDPGFRRNDAGGRCGTHPARPDVWAIEARGLPP